jgi:hypothetical protein
VTLYHPFGTLADPFKPHRSPYFIDEILKSQITDLSFLTIIMGMRTIAGKYQAQLQIGHQFNWTSTLYKSKV